VTYIHTYIGGRLKSSWTSGSEPRLCVLQILTYLYSHKLKLWYRLDGLRHE